MTSPNFLSGIQHTGFIPQPGIGDVLGEQFKNLAQAKVVQTEMKQRQQQQDQLGQYYQGQVNEMQRLRDAQEQQARAQEMAQRQLMAKRAELNARYPIPDGADERTDWEIRTKRALAMAEYGDPMAGPVSAILNTMRPKDAGKPMEHDPTKALVDEKGTVLIPAAPAAPGKKVERTVDLGDKVEYIYTDGTRETKAKGRIPGGGGEGGTGGGAQEQRDMAREDRLRTNWEQVTQAHTIRADQVRVIQTAIESAKTGDAPAQMSMIYAFMKMVDPRSSVRETEYANAQNAAGVPDRVRNTWNKLQKGTILTPEQVKSFYNEALGQASAGAKEVRRQREKFQKMAERWHVNPDILDDPYTDVVPEASPEDAAAAKRVRDGKP